MYKRRVKRTASATLVVRCPVPNTTQEVASKEVSSASSTPPEPPETRRSTKHLRERKENVSFAQSPKKSKDLKKKVKTQSDVQKSSNDSENMFISQDKQIPFFENVLSSCGLIMNDPEAYVLSVDQAIFVRDLKLKLEGSANFPLNVIGPKGFLRTFQEFYSNPENLKKSLQIIKSADNGKVWRNFQDSLMHLLLQVNCLQRRLIEFLCEKLVEFVCLDDRDASNVKNYPWTPMILRQFKFLDHVVDPETFLSLIFDVLSSVPEKSDVLLCLPDIIQDSQNEETAEKLSKLLYQDCEMSSFTPSVLDTLTNLTLTPELQKSVSENVMKCLGSVQLEYLPNMVRFLVTSANPDDIPELISKFRQHLDFSSVLLSLSGSGRKTAGSGAGPTSVKSCELLTVEVLKWSVMVSRPMAEGWLNAIKAVHSASQHQPLDLVMLLVLHAYVPVARTLVQAMFKQKARLGLFREKLLTTTFSTMLEVIKEYRTTLMEIMFVLLKSPDPAVLQHASCWYKLCLLHLPSWQAQAVVQRLLLHVGTGSVASMRAALLVLGGLATDNLGTLLPHQWLLQNLLDKVPYVDLSKVEMIMEVLCRVAFGSETQNGSTMDDNILMLARKQLSSWSPDIRKKGVIGAIMAAKHMAAKETEKSTNLNETIKHAIELMELVTASTATFPDANGLFLDKLSSVLCSVEVLDEGFLTWITDYIGQSFEEKYVVPRKDINIEDDLMLMYNLDEPEEEEDDDVCIPLGHLVDRNCLSKRCQYPVIVVMHASLRLVRCVKYLSCGGNLGDIAALLTCPVLMPRIVEQQDFIDFAYPQEQNFVLDCIFHCVNWFRELVSAFACQKDPELRRCVLLRLQDLVGLQKKLACWLTCAIDYIPPPCQFHTTVKPPKTPKTKKAAKKRGKKRKKKSKKGNKKPRTSDASENADGDEEPEAEEEEAEPEENEDEPEFSTTDSVELKSYSSDLTEYRGFLREMDVDVVVLLTEPLIVPSAESTSNKGLTPPILLFLLHDLTAKVEYLLAPEAKRASPLKTASMKPVGFANLDTFAPLSFARNTIKLLPAMIDKLETIGVYCQSLLDESDNIRDAPSMFPENSADMKLCYYYILRIVAGLFHWTGFESKMNVDHLKNALKLLVKRSTKEDATKAGVQSLLVDAGRYVQKYVEHTLLLPAACNLVKVLSALCHLADNDLGMRKQIETTCRSFLGQRWYTVKGSEEKGSEFNQHVDTLLKTLFNSVSDKVQTVSDLVGPVFQEVGNCVKLGTKDWSLSTFPTVTKQNFPLLYRALCSALVQGVEELLEASANDGSSFKVWESAIDSLRGLMSIARIQNARSNLKAFVKSSLSLLKLFLKRALPLFGRMFRRKSNEVTAVLQTLQKSTRFLNSVCYYSKSTKDATLTSQVPAIRLVLEQFVVSVRTLLAKNDCRDAFWIGILKNRNLKGEEVLSQESEPVAEDQQEQEQDLPSDDDSDVDVDLANPAEDNEEENDDSMSSVSEVF